MYNDIYLQDESLGNDSNDNNKSLVIDQDDLYIVENLSQFDPPHEIVIEYAKK